MSQNTKISREFLEYSHQNTELADFSFKDILETMPYGQTKFESCAGFGNFCIMKGDSIENSLIGFWISNPSSTGSPFVFWLPIDAIFSKDYEDFLFGPVIEVTQNIKITSSELN